MAAAASSSVIVVGSIVVFGPGSVGFEAGVPVTGGPGRGDALAFDLGAVAGLAESETAAWRNDWRPMSIPAAIPSSPSTVASSKPFALTQNPSLSGPMYPSRSIKKLVG